MPASQTFVGGNGLCEHFHDPVPVNDRSQIIPVPNIADYKRQPPAGHQISVRKRDQKTPAGTAGIAAVPARDPLERPAAADKAIAAG